MVIIKLYELHQAIRDAMMYARWIRVGLLTRDTRYLIATRAELEKAITAIDELTTEIDKELDQ